MNPTTHPPRPYPNHLRPPPTGGRDSVFRPGCPVSPPLFAGCVPGTHEPPPPDGLEDAYHYPLTAALLVH